MKVDMITRSVSRTVDNKIIRVIANTVNDGSELMPGMGAYRHTIYIEFKKEDWKFFEYPKLEKKEFAGKPYLSFDYNNCSFNEIEVHWDVTYYDEIKYATLKNSTRVKVGWDFQHLGDDHYSTEDLGQHLLDAHAEEMMDQFVVIHEEREKESK